MYMLNRNQGETLYMYGIERKYTFVSHCKENTESQPSQNIEVR